MKFVLALGLLTAAFGSKDDQYYGGVMNPNLDEKMYWADSHNVLQDLSQFSALYIKVSGCAWSPIEDEGQGNYEDEAQEGNNGGGGEGQNAGDLWYLGRTQKRRANVAYSLYGTLVGEQDKGCTAKTYINSFFTRQGVESFVKAMQEAGKFQNVGVSSQCMISQYGTYDDGANYGYDQNNQAQAMYADQDYINKVMGYYYADQYNYNPYGGDYGGQGWNQNNNQAWSENSYGSGVNQWANNEYGQGNYVDTNANAQDADADADGNYGGQGWNQNNNQAWQYNSYGSNAENWVNDQYDNGGNRKLYENGQTRFGTYVSETVGCEGNAFVLKSFKGISCSDDNAIKVTSELTNFNKGIQAEQCTQIYSSSQVYNNDGENNNGQQQGMLSLLEVSKSCSVLEYPDSCPDPHGKNKKHSKKLSNATGSGLASEQKHLGVITFMLVVASAIMIWAVIEFRPRPHDELLQANSFARTISSAASRASSGFDKARSYLQEEVAEDEEEDVAASVAPAAPQEEANKDIAVVMLNEGSGRDNEKSKSKKKFKRPLVARVSMLFMGRKRRQQLEQKQASSQVSL